MCGFIGLFGTSNNVISLRDQVLGMSKKLRHRGPDWSGIYSSEKVILSHERLAIVDPASGGQPLFSPDRSLVLAVNGEIYNHRILRRQFEGKYQFQTESDCEVILALYQQKGIGFLEDINGIFAFALYDVLQDTFLIARDHIGIIPLYMGWDISGNFYVSSELKALEGICKLIREFPPGHFIYSKQGLEPEQWYHREWKNYDAVAENTSDIDSLRNAMEHAVERQLMSDVPYGVLLSGGLDSSIIAAVAKKYAARRIETGSISEAW
jgi:asparagine synthase (glutamine-hydrolysing)